MCICTQYSEIYSLCINSKEKCVLVVLVVYFLMGFLLRALSLCGYFIYDRMYCIYNYNIFLTVYSDVTIIKDIFIK